MPTPSIQTLVTDAQQVLNLDSISAVRSVVAVALANANTGTPLNPNLTTQQLWNEFYQVVNKPKSDIESIIANQLMKLLYAPPAPGGVGANGQVIFNDNGVLAGDSGLTFNPATDTLRAGLLIVPGNTQLATVGILYVGSLGSPKLKVDVAGTGETTIASATITGDLTVASSILKVTGGNVGINTATPTNTAGYKTLEIVGTGVNTGGMLRMKSSDSSVSSLDFLDNNGRGIFAVSNHNLRFGCNDIEQYRIQPLGIFTWYDGAGGTRMTLNSTGLGVGVTPDTGFRLTVKASRALARLESTTGTEDAFYQLKNTGGTFAIGIDNSTGSNQTGVGYASYLWSSGAYPFIVATNNAERFRIDSSGNVGVGVTPNAGWQSSWKAIDIGLIGGVSYGFGETNVTSNVYRINTGASRYKAAGSAATSYTQVSGTHIFSIAGVAANAGDPISFNPAMTLDASGNLLVGQTSLGVDGIVSIKGANGLGVEATAAGGSAFSANYSNTGTGYFGYFKYGGTLVGTIASTGAGNCTFNQVSDYRLKEAVQPLVGGLARILALKPSVYKWKANGSAGEGFLAHELAESIPFAVTGEKDAVAQNGEINPQQVDLSKVVPVLVAAIKELTARVEALEA